MTGDEGWGGVMRGGEGWGGREDIDHREVGKLIQHFWYNFFVCLLEVLPLK